MRQILTTSLDELWLELNRLSNHADHCHTHANKARLIFAQLKQQLEKESAHEKSRL